MDLCSAALLAGTVASVVMRTPEWLTHYTWSYTLRRSYTLEPTRVLADDQHKQSTHHRDVTYDHSFTDGELLVAQLRVCPLPPLSKLPPADVCKWWCTVRLASATNESEFLRLVAHICASSSFMRHGHVVSTVLVSTRHRLAPHERHKSGSFLRSIRVRVLAGDTEQQIADMHRMKIEHILHSSESLCDSIADRVAKLTTHYVFNKWMLHTICRDDGRVLRIVHGGTQVSLEYIAGLHRPLELKCVRHQPDEWLIFASPIPTLLL